jgi:hypothetical protein
MARTSTMSNVSSAPAKRALKKSTPSNSGSDDALARPHPDDDLRAFAGRELDAIQPRVASGSAPTVRELVQPLQPRRGRAAQDAERGPDLGGRVPRPLADGPQRRPRLLRIGGQDVAGDAGLDVDDGDRVGEDVVQLAGDPQPLLLDPALRFPLCALAALGAQGAAATDDLAQQDHRGEQRDVGDGAGSDGHEQRLAFREGAVDDGGQREHRHHRDHRPHVTRRDGRVGGDRERHRESNRRVVGGVIELQRDGRGDERQDGPPAPHEQRDRHGDPEDVGHDVRVLCAGLLRGSDRQADRQGRGGRDHQFTRDPARPVDDGGRRGCGREHAHTDLGKRGCPDHSLRAEGEGFEPSVQGLPTQRFSRPPRSTTPAPLRGDCAG